MKILLVNYRYFISGGPEKYMFNIKKMLEEHGHEVIPFSIMSNKNVETSYSKYFVEPIGSRDAVYFDEVKKQNKVARYEYWFVIVDNNNKFCNVLANTEYLINNRENVYRMNNDLRKVTKDNIRAVVDFRMLRKFYITDDKKED